MNKKRAVVIHSGGMDSTLCLALAIKEFGAHAVSSLSFNYSQRLAQELTSAKQICHDWNVDHKVVNIDFLSQITDNALINKSSTIEHTSGNPPNTLVLGRNGLMARLGAIYAHMIEAPCIYMGVMELEVANSGYRDCSRAYMDLMQKVLQIDLDNPSFEIVTPLVYMTKLETLQIANKMGILPYLLKKTITCYEGLSGYGCRSCPSCILRNEGLNSFLKMHPEFAMPY